MFSFFDDDDSAFQLNSSPIPYEQGTDEDFSLDLKSPSPARTADADIFLDFGSVDYVIPDVFNYTKPEPQPTSVKKEFVTPLIYVPGQHPPPPPQPQIHQQQIRVQKCHQEKVVEPKKQKLRRKVEVFQPFASFSNLELTVKSLQAIIGNQNPVSNRIYAPTLTTSY